MGAFPAMCQDLGPGMPSPLARALALADAGIGWLARSADEEPRPADTPAPSLFRPALVGFVGSVLMALTMTHRGRYFPITRQSDWPWHLPWLSSRGHLQQFLATSGFWVGVGLFVAAWLVILRRARTHSVSPRLVLGIFALWVVPLLVAPPLFSRDVYAYAADGQLVSRGFDPYRFSPSTLPWGTPFYRSVHPVWRHTGAPYGPLFMRIAGFTTAVAGHRLAVTVMLLRGLSLGGVLLAVAALPRLVRRYRQDMGLVMVLALLNPLTVLHLIGGAHNDALMIGLLLAGLASAMSGRWRTGIVLCAIGGAIKLPALGGVIFLGWTGAGVGAPLVARLRSLGRAALIGGASLALATLACAMSWWWTFTLNVPAKAHPLLAPVDALGFAVARPFHLQVVPITQLLRAVALLVMLALLAYLVLRSERVGTTRAIGWTLLAYATLGPTLYPWYFTWGVVLVAATGLGALRKPLIATCVIVNFAYAPSGDGLLETLQGTMKLAGVVAFVVLLLVVGAGLLARLLRYARAPVGGVPLPLEGEAA